MDQPRVPKGTPARGGQWAEVRLPEGDDLGSHHHLELDPKTQAVLDTLIADLGSAGGSVTAVGGSVRDRANIEGFATLSGGVDVYGSATVTDYASVFDHATVGDEARVDGNARVHGPHAHLYGPAQVHGFEDVKISG